jgi:hypothetical protein
MTPRASLYSGTSDAPKGVAWKRPLTWVTNGRTGLESPAIRVEAVRPPTWPQRRATQVPTLKSQSGRAEGQSAFRRHCTQSFVTGSHRGVVPLHIVSSLQAAHMCETQIGPAAEPAQPMPSSHCPQTESSHLGAEAGHPTLQGIVQRPARHTSALEQSAETPHATQRWSARSQRGNPGAVQWASVTHATHWPALQCSEGRPQSGSCVQVASSSKRMSP